MNKFSSIINPFSRSTITTFQFIREKKNYQNQNQVADIITNSGRGRTHFTVPPHHKISLKNQS